MSYRNLQNIVAPLVLCYMYVSYDYFPRDMLSNCEKVLLNASCGVKISRTALSFCKNINFVT